MAPLFLVASVGEARVAEPGADREHAPVPDVLHVRHLAQPLYHRIVVHQDGGAVIADLRNRLEQLSRQVELAAGPIARQVLRAAVDRAVALDDPWAADTDEGR